MTVAVESISDVPVVRVSGDVDMSNTGSIEDAIASAVTNRAHGMVLDLSGTTYLDSAGIRMLYHAESRLAMHQQRLVIVVPTEAQIRRALQAAGVIGSLILTSTVETALAVAKAEEPEADTTKTTG